MPEIIKFDDPVVLVGGGEVDIGLLAQLSVLSIVAADGGANHLRSHNIVPDLIVGDMDSIEDIDYWQSVTAIKQIAEQDTTDFEKCLYSIDAPVFLALGFLGGRFDHSLGSLHVIQKYHQQLQVVLVGKEDVMLVSSSAIELNLPLQTRVSVYPLGKVVFESSAGLQYPLDGLTMEPGHLIGTSNTCVQERVAINPVSGCYALILPVEILPAVLCHHGVSQKLLSSLM